jgi:cytosine deaminase
MDKFLEAAIEEARQGMDAGGIPIGSVLVIDNQMEVPYYMLKWIV